MKQGENASGEQYHRIQFDFTPESLEELLGLKYALRLKTKADVVRFALRILGWAVEQSRDGNRILVERGGELQEVVFPFLPRLESAAGIGAEPKKDLGREYAQRKARELRDRAEDLIERSKEIMGRQKDSLSAAVEAGKASHQREKSKTS